MLKLLSLPEDTQTWTRFDKRAKPYRTTSSSGPLWEKVIVRITIDDKTGHIMSLEYTKHMNEKDVHRNVHSVRDMQTDTPHASFFSCSLQKIILCISHCMAQDEPP